MATKKLDYEGLQTLVTVVKDYVRKHAGIPIGHEYFSVNPNIPEGSLPLFGGEYSRETYSDLWAWVQTQTGYLKTEADWQTLSTANNGNVPFYSDGDGSTTFRVPSLKCWVKSANGTINEVGSYLEAGLPNITGKIHSSERLFVSAQAYGVFGFADIYQNYYSSDSIIQNSPNTFNFDASRSSAIYGNSSTVQPQSIVGLWLVKAYGTVIETGSIDEKQYVDDRIATCLPLTGGTMLGNINFGESGAIGYKGSWHGDTGQILPQLVLSSTDIEHWTNDPGAKMVLHTYGETGTNSANGGFEILASDGTNNKILKGYPDGGLSWDGHNVITNELTGNVLSASGSSTAINSVIALCSITNHSAGIWLIVSFVGVSYSTSTDGHNNEILTASHGGKTARTICWAGGGNINVRIEQLNQNEAVTLRGYQVHSGVISGDLYMVRIA